MEDFKTDNGKLTLTKRYIDGDAKRFYDNNPSYRQEVEKLYTDKPFYINYKEWGDLWEAYDGLPTELKTVTLHMVNSERLLSTEVKDRLKFINGNSKDFVGLEGYNKALKYIKEGRVTDSFINEVECAKSILSNKLEELLPSTCTRKTRRRRDELEGELSIERYIAKDFDELFDYVDRNKTQKTITLAVNGAISCGNSENTFMRMMAQVYATAERLTELGYSVKIIGCNIGSYASRINIDLYTLKEAGSPLDIQAVCSVSLPQLLRVVGFALIRARRGDDNHNVHCVFNTKERDAIMDRFNIDALFSDNWIDNNEQLENLALRLNGGIEDAK
jgi:hypothetical protein